MPRTADPNARIGSSTIGVSFCRVRRPWGVAPAMVVWFGGFLLLMSGEAAAQPNSETTPSRSAPEQAASPRADATPPELLDFVEAPYPPDALAAGIAGIVQLVITVDAAGAVTAVEVVQAPSDALGRAAQAAAEQFRFRPAVKNGSPIASRIPYEYRFQLAAPAIGAIEGSILLTPAGGQNGQDAATASALSTPARAPAVNARVVAVADDGTQYETHTDASGNYRFDQLPAGQYVLTATLLGAGTTRGAAPVAAGQTTRGALVIATEGAVPTAAAEQVRTTVSAEAEPIEVAVRGKSIERRMEESAEAVKVVDMKEAKRESADLGDVLRRQPGVNVRRTGGLGSDTNFTLNGMAGDQVRFFMDEIPLEFTGFLNFSTVPVNLLGRVELYSGVVPVRFGTDALGGAVNLVTDHAYGRARGALSYQAGSFGTHRAAASMRHRFGNSPFVIAGTGFLDYSENDYPIDVEVPNEQGRLQPATVRRFHDAYRAVGGSLEFGVVELPWARRLLVRGYTTDWFKEHQHNAVMTRPYGEVESAEQTRGVNLRYATPLGLVEGGRVEALAAYARRVLEFDDVARCAYDWSGRCIREGLAGGEIGAATDNTYVEHRGLLRLGLFYRFGEDHEARLVSTLNVTSRTGDDHLYQSDEFRDPLTQERRVSTVITGLEYQLDALSDRLENVLFAKHYFYGLTLETGDRTPIDAGFSRASRLSHDVGVGDGLRFLFADWLMAKVTYEYATRLPEPDQVFGNGALVLASTDLEPEVSHNANVGVGIHDLGIGQHTLRSEASAFVRYTDQLIIALPIGVDYTQYHNVASARSVGVEASIGWTSPGDYVALDANGSWVDLRNTSTEGPFKDFNGDRIPNRSWLYANGSARLQVSGVGTPRDRISLTWRTNYVNAFYRGWESTGRPEYKLEIPHQLTHALALTYLVHGDRTFSASAEMQNLTNTKIYDYWGVQKPGRALYFKATLEL